MSTFSQPPTPGCGNDALRDMAPRRERNTAGWDHPISGKFRVHWSILALNSSFFRDMQGLPQPPVEPSVECCPVVELSDQVEDVECILKALYDPKPFLSPIASHIRLGRKYVFTDVLASVVERLTYENPTTLEEYNFLLNRHLSAGNNLLSVLPAEVFDGTTLNSGALITLSPIDQRRCSLGHTGPLTSPMEYRKHTRGYKISVPPQTVAEWRALCLLVRTGFSHRLVGSVQTMSKTKAIAGRQKMGELLPTFFDLPPWEELKNDI
ncbi:hypothetical protein B0H13DRAFT_1906039 [Mycena leptocephala]|nr:hypothetical protein B0H13DRAFT_1906039 [Mycena leptocephala]